MFVVNRYDEPERMAQLYGADCPVTTWDMNEEHPPVKPGDVVEKCGYVVRWSEKHRTGAQLKHLRQIGDENVDLICRQPPTSVKRGSDGMYDFATWLYQQYNTGDIDETLSAEQQAAVKSLINECCYEPAWLDTDRLRQGQILFLRYPLAAMMSLFNHSLLAGVSAPKINKVLTATNYLSSPSSAAVYKRLVDTTQFVVDLLHEHAMQVGGVGWTSCINVRFLHGQVRHRLLQRKAPKEWKSSEDGVPINVEDNQTTLLAFSLNVLLGSEKMGIHTTRQEKEDYIHLWRWCGVLLGLPDEHNPCTSVDDAFVHLGGLLMHSVDPAADSSTQMLANNLLGAVANQYKMIRWFSGLNLPRPPNYYHTLVARHMLGKHLSDQLELPKVDGTITIQKDGFSAWLTYQRVKKVVSAMFHVYSAWGKVSYIPCLQSAVLRGNMKFLEDWLASQKEDVPQQQHPVTSKEPAASMSCPHMQQSAD